MKNDNPYRSVRRLFQVSILTAIVVLSSAGPVLAEEASVLDHFSLGLEASFLDMTTGFRLDSPTLGRGTSITFEDDLGLDASKAVPSLSFEWTVARRHQLGFRWQDIGRNSSRQSVSEIVIGDQTIPIASDVDLVFDMTEFAIDYSYFPWVGPRSATGFGIGVRVLTFDVGLEWRGQNITDGAESAEATGPLPYLFLQHTRLIGDDWRLNARAGWLDVEIDEYDGGQLVAHLGIDYLLGQRWSLGLSSRYSDVDVDWDERHLNGHVDLDIFDLSVLFRARW